MLFRSFDWPATRGERFNSKANQSTSSPLQQRASVRCQATSSAAEKKQNKGIYRGIQYTNNVVEAQSKRKVPTKSTEHQRKRVKVAVDVDEVLGRFLYSLNKYCEEEYKVCYDLSDYKQYDFASVWGCTLDEANRRVHDFFESHYFALGILPIPGARPSLQRLQSVCDLVVVTSRQHAIQEQTMEWLDKEFPGIFTEVHFGNHWALSGKSRKKSEICREIGATVLIDDNPRYAKDCAEAGIDVLLYDWQLRYPWAKTSDGPTHPLIKRVQDWNDVESQLNILVARQ